MPRLRHTMFFYETHVLADRFPYVSIFDIWFSAFQLKTRLRNYFIRNPISCAWEAAQRPVQTMAFRRETAVFSRLNADHLPHGELWSLADCCMQIRSPPSPPKPLVLGVTTGTMPCSLCAFNNYPFLQEQKGTSFLWLFTTAWVNSKTVSSLQLFSNKRFFTLK